MPRGGLLLLERIPLSDRAMPRTPFSSGRMSAGDELQHTHITLKGCCHKQSAKLSTQHAKPALLNGIFMGGPETPFFNSTLLHLQAHEYALAMLQSN